MDSCDALKVWKRMDCIACWAAVWCFVALAQFLVRYERAAGTARGRLAAPRGAARLVDGRAGVIVRDCRARQRDTVICVCFTPTRVPCRRSMIGPVAVWPYVCVSSAVTPYVTRYPGRMCIRYGARRARASRASARAARGRGPGPVTRARRSNRGRNGQCSATTSKMHVIWLKHF